MLFLDREFRKFNRTASLRLEYEFLRLLLRGKEPAVAFAIFR